MSDMFDHSRTLTPGLSVHLALLHLAVRCTVATVPITCNVTDTRCILWMKYRLVQDFDWGWPSRIKVRSRFTRKDDSFPLLRLHRGYDIDFCPPLWDPFRIVSSGVPASAILVIFTLLRNDTLASRVTILSVILEATAEKMNGLGETFYIVRGGF